MTSDVFFISLSKTLFESCLQGLAVWAALRIILLFLPSAPSAVRYRLYYGALGLVFLGFVITLLYHSWQAPVLTRPLIVNAGIETTPTGQVAALDYFRKGEFILNGYSLWISLFYLLGLVFNTVNLLSAKLQVSQLKRFRQEQSELWKERLDVLRERIGVSKEVKLYFTRMFDVPFTTGLAKPLIYFPLAALNDLSIAQVEALLLHELAHIRRNDYLFNLVQQVMKSFLFFNPFALILNRSICREREYCCDDLVLGHSGSSAEYAHALLQIAESRNRSPELALAANDGKYPLLNRIKRMIMKNNQPSSLQRFGILMFSVAVLASLAFVIPSKEKTAKKNSVKNAHILSQALIPEALHPLVVNPSVFVAPGDTAPAKKKMKIVVEDEKGNKTEYPSYTQLPDSLKSSFFYPDSNQFGKAWKEQWAKSMQYFNSPAWKDELAKTSKYFQSPEWKKQMAELTNMANSPEWKKQQEETQKYFNSPEWKKQMEDTQKYFQGAEWKKQMEDVQKYFNSDDWKKQMELSQAEMKKYFDGDAWKKQTEDMKKYFESDAWKKQVDDLKASSEEMQKAFNRPEWKKEMELLQKNGDSEEMKKLQKKNDEIRKELEKTKKELEKLEKKKPTKGE